MYRGIARQARHARAADRMWKTHMQAKAWVCWTHVLNTRRHGVAILKKVGWEIHSTAAQTAWDAWSAYMQHRRGRKVCSCLLKIYAALLVGQLPH